MEKNIPNSSWRNYTRYQWTVLILFTLLNIFGGMMFSIQAPFFPALAEKKDLSSLDSGIVFGVYHLTGFFMSPLLGTYMNVIGPKTGIYAGAIIAGSSSICFGLLDRINDNLWFLGVAIILRIFEGIGTSALFVFINSFVILQFTISVATTFALMKTGYAIGYCIGPAVGEFFYQIGGFTMAFTMLGGILISSPIVLHYFLANTANGDESGHSNSEDMDDSSSHLGFFELLKISTVLGGAYGTFVAGFELGFLANTLEQHLRQVFNLSPTMIGFSFLLYGTAYVLSAPLFGYICDRINEPSYVNIAGALFLFTAFLAIGPAPFIPIKPILWLTWCGLVLFGIGMEAIFISTFMSTLKDAWRHNYPDSTRTYGLINGLWNSSVALGSLLGPVTAGVLQDHFGFRNAEYSVLAVSASLVFVSIFCILERRSSVKPGVSPLKSEQTPLISGKIIN